MINNSDLFEFEGNIITICLTSHCNTNCKHCYIGHHGAWNYDELKALLPVFRKKYKTQIAITSWTPRGKNLGHGWSRRIYP